MFRRSGQAIHRKTEWRRFFPVSRICSHPESLKLAEYEDEDPGSENANGEQNEEPSDDDDTSKSKLPKDHDSENSLLSPPY